MIKRIHKYIIRNWDALLFLFLLSMSLWFITSCRAVKDIPVETKIEYNYRDTFIQHIDTTFITIEKTRYKDFVNVNDTLYLQNKYASARAYLDTLNRILVGELQSIPQQIPVYVKGENHIVYKDSIIYKDKINTVEVERTKHPDYEFLLWLYVFVTLCGGMLYIKFKR